MPFHHVPYHQSYCARTTARVEQFTQQQTRFNLSWRYLGQWHPAREVGALAPAQLSRPSAQTSPCGPAVPSICNLLMRDPGIQHLEDLNLLGVAQPRARILVRPPFHCRAFRWSRLSSPSCGRLRLPVLATQALQIDAACSEVANHAAANAVEPPATSSVAAVAIRGLRCSVRLKAQQFTFCTQHGVPLHTAARICSSTVCPSPRGVGVCIGAIDCCRGANRHYTGTALSGAKWHY